MSGAVEPTRPTPRPKSVHYQSVGEGGSSTGTVGQPKVVQMNLGAVQRVDPHVQGLVSTVTQVVLYQYEEDTNTWERTSIEGTLFVYSRDVEPSHGFVLLNRLSSDNLHEVMEKGMEYRVQGQFVLFNKHSDPKKIFGLCFTDAAVCSETGQLLSILSSANVSNGYGTSGASFAPDMRSKSVPIISRQQESDDKVDILEMLESAGHSYLNQVFSDDASSQESPPSETITFTAPPTTRHGQELREAAEEVKLSQAIPQGGRRGKERKGPKRTSSPRTIPKVGPSGPPSSRTTSRSQQHGSSNISVLPKPKQKAGSPRNTVPDQPQVAVGMRTNGPTPTQELREPLRAVTAPGGRAAGLVSSNTSPSKRSHPRRPGPAEQSSAVPRDMEPLARRLFGTAPEGGSSSSNTPPSLQTLFSQSLPPQGSRGVSTGDLSRTSGPTSHFQPMSLAEIEKQMSEEVPSPDATKPFSLPRTASLSASQPSTTVPNSSQVLLQPSAFSATPTQQSATPPNAHYTVASGHSMSTPHRTTSRSVPHSHNTASSTVALTVEPPSPVVNHQPTSGGSVFPGAPPLMHSPGMRAAPVQSQLLQKQVTSSLVKQVQGGGSQGGEARRAKVVSRSAARSTTPEKSMSSPTPQQRNVDAVDGLAARSMSVPNNMTPLSVSTPAQPAPPPPTLFSPMQFSNAAEALIEPPEQPVQPSELPLPPLSREQFKQALIHLIQNDDDFITRLHSSYQHTLLPHHQ